MNENILKIICEKYPNIAISIQDWCYIIKDSTLRKTMGIITQKNLLRNGYYGSLFGCKIIVTKIISEGYFRISMKIDPINPNKKIEDWSPEMSFKFSMKDIEKYLNLTAFW